MNVFVLFWASLFVLFRQYPVALGFLVPTLQVHCRRSVDAPPVLQNNVDGAFDNDSSQSSVMTGLSRGSFSEEQNQLIEMKKQQVISQLEIGAEEVLSILSIVFDTTLQGTVTPTDIVTCCDALDNLEQTSAEKSDEFPSSSDILKYLRRRALEFRRYSLLAKIQAQDYDSYVATASFLSPSRIPRQELPNVQDIPYNNKDQTVPSTALVDVNGVPLVPDCELDNVEFDDSLLDKLLLYIFRSLVTEHTGGVTSDKEGINGLLEQGRTFMLQKGQTPEAQHQMVYNTLKSLMTPILPPFYRLFMSGIIPKVNSPWDGKQLGPWFYAPFLTSFVTPTFFGFLVGPSRPNRRRDGALGGLVVEKCKFLQESGCKGLCLHQCKLPAQKFFAEELGLPLTVSPNFVTQECQWSFGEVPLLPSEDPAFPSGCLNGCSSRIELFATIGKDAARKVDLCNYSG